MVLQDVPEATSLEKTGHFIISLPRLKLYTYLASCHRRAVRGKQRARVCLSARLPVPRGVGPRPAPREDALVPAGPAGAAGSLGSVRVGTRGADGGCQFLSCANSWVLSCKRDRGIAPHRVGSVALQRVQSFCYDCELSSMQLSPAITDGCKNT